MVAEAAVPFSIGSDVVAPVVNTYAGLVPLVGVAVIWKRGRVPSIVGGATPTTSTPLGTVVTVAMLGSSATTVNVAGTMLPFFVSRAVRNICDWKPGGMLSAE